MSYAEELRRIQELHAKRKEVVQPPCPPGQIELLKRRMRKLLGCELPGAYEEFLLMSNGLDWDGMTFLSAGYDLMSGQKFLAIRDVAEANLAYRETSGFDGKLVIGDSGTDVYIHYLDDSHAAMVDRISLYEFETFPSVRELMLSALRRSLTIYDE